MKIEIVNDEVVRMWVKDNYECLFLREVEQLIVDLQKVSVQLKTKQLPERKVTLKTPFSKLEEEIEQLKDRVSMLEYKNRTML